MQHVFDLMQRLHATLTEAGVEYRVVGGMAVFLQVSERDPEAARSTRDIDVAVSRGDMQRIAAGAERHGFRYRHVEGVGMLVDSTEPKGRSAVHFIFVGERVRPDYLEPVPAFSEPRRTIEGFPLAPVVDLVRMKLTSYRFKDRAHIVDLDWVGLITPEIERQLSEPLLLRLRAVRAEERQSAGAE